MSGIMTTSRASGRLRAIAEELAARASAWRPRRGWTSGDDGPDTTDLDARVAACAILLEIAYADEEFSEAERRHVESTLRREFGLGPAQAEGLVRAAEEARDEAPGAWRFTNEIIERYSAARKALLAEILQAVAHSDGHATWEEDYAMRKLFALLRLGPELV